MSQRAPLKATFIFDIEPIAGCGIDTKHGYLAEASRLSHLLNSWIRFKFNGQAINVLLDFAYIEDSYAGWRQTPEGEWEKFGDHEESWRKFREKLVKEGSYPG